MKRSMLCAVLLSIGITLSGQSTSSVLPAPKTDFLQKSKAQRNMGYALLAAGTIAVAVPTIILAGDDDFLDPDADFERISMGIGVLMVAGGVTLFIVAGRCKTKGMRIALDAETTPIFQSGGIVYSRVPAASFVYTF